MESTTDRFGENFGAERMWGLKELPYPDPVPFTPQTMGWLLLGLLFLILLAWAAWRLRQRTRRNTYRRQGRQRLRLIAARAAPLSQLPYVLRKAALLSNPRHEVASLRGTAWTDLLNETAGRPLFTVADAETLDRLAYLPDEELATSVDATTARRLIDAAQAWMGAHRAGV